MTKTLIGRIDKIDLPELDMWNIPAKIDTGANRSSLHCHHLRVKRENGLEVLYFTIDKAYGKTQQTHHTSKFTQKVIKSSTGHAQERFVITTKVLLFGQVYVTTFSLSDRQEMQYPILLGRKLLRKGFLVDVTLENLSHHEKHKHT